MVEVNQDLSDFPEMEYFMNEEKSDVVFVIEGQRLPARKELLIIKNRVFRAMFSGEFKESKDNEVVIKETTFEAFKTLIQFLYCEQLVLKDKNYSNLIEEVFKLCDRYEAKRLMNKMSEHLMRFCLTFDNIELISRISFNYEIKNMITKVMTYFSDNLNQFANKGVEELIKYNESTKGSLFKVMAEKYSKIDDELSAMKGRVASLEAQVNNHNRRYNNGQVITTFH